MFIFFFLTHALKPTTSGSAAPTGLCASNPVGSFVDGTSIPGTLTGNANKPWQVDTSGGCLSAGVFDTNSESQITAGIGSGVDSTSTLSIVIPGGATSVRFLYSSDRLDPGDVFTVSGVDGGPINLKGE